MGQLFGIYLGVVSHIVPVLLMVVVISITQR